MKKSTRKILNAAPVVKHLSEPGTLTDNKLETAIRQLGFAKLLTQADFRKQKGDELLQVLFALIIWPLLDVRSISNFCGKLISVFILGGSNVLYDFQKREDLKWRKLRQLTAKNIYIENGFAEEKVKAFVFDDTLKARRGKKVEGSSTHFDHTANRHIKGQQVLEMGLVAPKGYIPIDSQIYVGDKNRVEKKKSFKNPSSSVAVDYRCALKDTKNKMLKQMLKRALRTGFKVDYVLADAWFGNKGNIEAVILSKLIGIFRMKNSKMRYRINGKLLTAKALYHIIKFKTKASKKQPWKTFAIEVEINLEEEQNKKPRWKAVSLVFAIPKNQKKDEFALFLSTDNSLSKEKVLEIYSLRWSIEVYFKEIKQYMGLLKEQTGNYVCHYMSVHLTAIRYALFSHIFYTEGGGKFGMVRKRISDGMQMLSFATILWELFKAIIFGALDLFRKLLGDDLLRIIKETINTTVLEFLESALQLDATSLQAEARALKACTL